MHLHILGISGTFMGGIALLAKQLGHEVSGADLNIYPPMSTQLETHGIQITNYDDLAILDRSDVVIVGNVIKRGNPAIEHVLLHQIPYVSGPEWLYNEVLRKRWVLAVAGTHGKTTTTSLLTWILEYAGCEPGFLIGGVPENFGVSAKLGKDPYFVIEADEYDGAFFDKRSKFIHYHPRTLILNNLEYDHADIFPDLSAIKLQFHYLVRTIPANGKIIHPAQDIELNSVLEMGCWTPTTSFSGPSSEWQARLLSNDGCAFAVLRNGTLIGEARWNLLGQHNVNNALAAIAAADHINIPVEKALEALSTFKNVKRRLEVKGKVKDIIVYDDFAHHPTAIATTLAGLRANIGRNARMIAVLEFGSYTMRQGVHKLKIQSALEDADVIICKDTETDWGLKTVLAQCKQPTAIYPDVDTLVKQLVPNLKAGDHVVVMSNSGFGGIHHKLLAAIEQAP